MTTPAAGRPEVARVAAAVAWRTTGWVGARHEAMRVAVAVEDEEQLKIQNQVPTQTPHPQVRAVAAEEQWARRGVRLSGVRTGVEAVEDGARVPQKSDTAPAPASDPETRDRCCSGCGVERNGDDGDGTAERTGGGGGGSEAAVTAPDTLGEAEEADRAFAPPCMTKR